MDTTIIEQFTRVLAGPEAVITDPQVLTTAGHDFWGFGGTPGLLLRPGSRDEVVAVMRLATTHQIPVVPQGGASNCSAGMMPNQDRILLDLRNMNRVLDIDVAARRAHVQPGVINAALQQQLAPYGLCFSLDPVSQRSQPSPTFEVALRRALDGYRTHTGLPTHSKTAESTKSTGRRDMAINSGSTNN